MADASIDPVVIVGAGQAGAWVAATLRKLDPDRPIVMIGEEPVAPYERPPLSKAFLAGFSGIESAFIQPPSFYAENAIDLRLGQRVEAIDRGSRHVVLADGSRLAYGRLVLATGCRPRRLAVPGADLPIVHVLRTTAHADAIRKGLVKARRVVAVGAGFIGLEVAAVARRMGCDVTVVESAAGALGRMVAPAVAREIAQMHERQGVRFRFGVGVSAIGQAGTRAEVVLSDGSSFPADLVVVGIGAQPETALAEAAGLACGNGILVDEVGMSSDPAIFAAGDVANHYNPLLDRRLRLESWQNAQNQGIAVGRTLAGQPSPYAEIPWFWTDQFDWNVQIVGAAEQWDRLVWRGDPASGQATVFYLKDEAIVAANMINSPRDVRPVRKLMASGSRVSTSDLEDRSRSLGELSKAG